MAKPFPKLIKINSCSNPKTPLFQPLYQQQIHPEVLISETQLICASCQKWLRGQTKIQANNNMYCVSCFSTVLPDCEYYRVLSHQSFQLVGDGWPARDEILLLTAIQKFGFGNWAAIQGYMATLGANYFNDQIQLHFDKFYGKNLEPKILPMAQYCKTKVSNPSRKSKNQHTRTGKSIDRSTAYELFRANQLQQRSIPCYNSKRGQFNIQYKQNLQKYIADLQFRDNDSQKEIEIKFKMLEAYNMGLQDRINKHNFILEHKLLDENYQAEQNKLFQLNPFANKAHQLLIDLMRTMTHQQYLKLRKSIQFCLKIQATIDSLRALRSSNTTCSIETVTKLKQSMDRSEQQLGKPRKKVHKSSNTVRDNQEKAILKKLNVNKEQLEAVIEKARQQNQTVIYKDIKITPINNLAL